LLGTWAVGKLSVWAARSLTPAPSFVACPQERSHAASPIQDAQARDREKRVPLLILIPAPPFAVVLVLFLVALLRCDRNDIPAS
jgi:hypothetical protein